jgi:hypothetical protein
VVIGFYPETNGTRLTFSRTPLLTASDMPGESSVGRPAAACTYRCILFLIVSYVCPEPALANIGFISIKVTKKTFY